MSSSSQDSTQFRATRWSLATLGDAATADGGIQPLAELCAGYRYPAYAFARCSGHEPVVARRRVDAFLAALPGQADAQGLRDFASFRAFLLDRLRHSMTQDRAAGTGPMASPPVDDASQDLETRLLAHGLLERKPAEAFMRGFGLQVIDRVRTRLRADAAAGQRIDLFNALEPFLVREPGARVLQQLAADHGLGALALQLAIRRLRQRFRELIDLELAETVTTTAQLEAERAALLAALADSP